MRLSIIVPVLNEADGIAGFLQALAPLRSQGVELILVDGGSSDGSLALALPWADAVIATAKGRAVQMNAGAAVASGEALLFLHADTWLPANAIEAIRSALEQGACWGRFDVCIEGRSAWLRVLSFFMNWRSRLTGIATGDQAIFVTRQAFHSVGAFPVIDLMEDIALSMALKKLARPCCLSLRVRTSGRRWERHGLVRTMVLMWRLRLAYFLGADPNRLAHRYDPAAKSKRA